MTKTCAKCGEVGTGRFCANCGASLDVPTHCASCSNPLPAGARFCNMCGTPVAGASPSAGTRSKAAATSAAVPESTGTASVTAAAATSPSPLPWVVAGVAVVALAAFLIIPRLGGEGGSDMPPTPAASAGSGAPTAEELEAMGPREAAERLFTRIMTSASAGDSAAARAFAPMGIDAYRRAEPLDVDGRYHLATLYIVAGRAEEAAAEAATILQEVPTHLFGFYTAAQAAAMLGRTEEAREHFRGLLANYDAEVALQREEYIAHEPILPQMRRDAVAATGN